MSTLNDFIVAAASYFGLPDGQTMEGSTIDTSTGDLELVLRIALKPDDMVGIGKRMDVLMREQAVDRAQAAKAEQPVALSDAELRTVYNALTVPERSAYGSFAKFKAAHGVADKYAMPEPVAKVELPAHVWVPARELTEQQKMLSVGRDATDGKYAMDPADLTPEQLQEWGPK